jgi:D-3-phosphoglycerate dehydrogenase / 2-oxoglutarate reductase
MGHRVLVTDYIWPNLDPERAALSPTGAEIVEAPSGDETTLRTLAADCDAIITCFAKVTPAVIDACPRCRIISRYGIGLDNIAVDHATRRGIPVTNVPAYCVDEVSDHTLALVLACARKVTRWNALVHGGNWDSRVHMPLRRLRLQTLGIVGFGKIGRLVATKARPFGFRILVHDRYVPAEAVTAAGCEAASLDAVFAESDYVCLHAPLTPETERLVGARTLALMKPSAYVINTSRGGLVDIDALYSTLTAGRLAGAALDVMPSEPPIEHPILSLDSVIFSPHVAFYSEESLVELQTTAAQAVATVLMGGIPPNVINSAALGL